ncbi:tetratricopeptide repeat protein [Saccharothrix coeruleofusca]|uniref:Tetratricopeptide repeat protein n=1 Tax=Saccharothrix coeruleofusca TaxID=33919 RepID=A0A918ECM7_9PSEU|nr:tetratricopeptide repeat protein [Saccharothrix coeruleofusca]GGP41517.1 hypothetical protein GCM10010185_10900 [Saccharothrix coeruleofusca]
MAEDDPDTAAKLLQFLWVLLPNNPELTKDELRSVTFDLADRFPFSRSVPLPLREAVGAYVRAEDLTTATEVATRMVTLARALCREEPTEDTLHSHAFALDTLASVYRLRGMTEQFTACLVELIDVQFEHANPCGAAWGVRELGALDLLAGDLDAAVAKFSRAEQLYLENGEDAETSSELAECRVLLGRTALARGDRDTALVHFARALDGVTCGSTLAREVERLRDAAQRGQALPDTTVLRIGEFGTVTFERPSPTTSTT